MKNAKRFGDNIKILYLCGQIIYEKPLELIYGKE